MEREADDKRRHTHTYTQIYIYIYTYIRTYIWHSEEGGVKVGDEQSNDMTKWTAPTRGRRGESEWRERTS